eukprot:TRINITY_DN67_c0_g1_i1.p1 TRINITY_DN67_c0_g1~~TRINITY_DN67_c0_g1_i1.p1  ORF type:complete len:223 (-),score=50.60 TRINITY_DN67_c0_g1_i1:88-675(-)
MQRFSRNRSSSSSNVAPVSSTLEPIYETTTVRAPVVQETVRTDKIVEIQPVVHREVERPIINHIERHIAEPAAPHLDRTVGLAPVVETHVHSTVINEVQPIIHREVANVQVNRVEEHLTERFVEAPIHTSSVQYASSSSSLPSTTFQTNRTVVYNQQPAGYMTTTETAFVPVVPVAPLVAAPRKPSLRERIAMRY